MEKLLYRPREVAERLSLGRTVVYQLLRCGELPCVRIGRAVRVRATDLEAWVERQQTDQAVGR